MQGCTEDSFSESIILRPHFKKWHLVIILWESEKLPKVQTLTVCYLVLTNQKGLLNFIGKLIPCC